MLISGAAPGEGLQPSQECVPRCGGVSLPRTSLSTAPTGQSERRAYVPKTISCALNADALEAARCKRIRKTTSPKQPKLLCEGLWSPGTSWPGDCSEPRRVAGVCERLLCGRLSERAKHGARSRTPARRCGLQWNHSHLYTHGAESVAQRTTSLNQP